MEIAFARLSNISFSCFPLALTCITTPVLIKNGTGTR